MKEAILSKVSNLFPERNPNREKDIRLLYELLPSLSEEGIIAIYFRFWEQLLIEDIARIIGRTWEQTDRIIENSIKQLRDGFLKKQINKRLMAA